MIDLTLKDSQTRWLAAASCDRNVIVTASAGTGKTTLLVERLVHLLLRAGDPISLTDIVALTFMEKAAHEMKMRLRTRLQRLAAEPREAADITTLSAWQVRARANMALAEIDRSQIGTIHSFAAHLIRLYPVEAGVDPGFITDEGHHFEQQFDQYWRQWLGRELGPAAPRSEQWKDILSRTGLDTLREFANKLANDLVPLDALESQLEAPTLSPILLRWIEENLERANALLRGQRNGDREPRQIEKLLTAAADVFARAFSHGLGKLNDIDRDLTTFLQNKTPASKAPVGWTQSDFDEAQAVIRTAKAMVDIDHTYLAGVVQLLLPFVRDCRRRFMASGFVSFDGLLARGRDLLKNYPSVRRQLKRRFNAILVDEFQDTDPVQYEILLFLAERIGANAERWQDVQLQPGKLFIVGDPKQSIFAFRRADIEAFQRVTEQVLRQDGFSATLTTNFRSHASILSVVNGMFARLIVQQPGVQPAYDPLEPQPDRPTSAGIQGVELRLVCQDDHDVEELSAEQAARREAEAIARWLQSDIIGKELLIESDGRRRKVEPGDVAMLFRTFSQARDYLDALRRHHLPYVAEGERHFYQRQEVVDFVNLLRWVRNPDDPVARLAVLRSPLGALTDREIVELAALGAWDYRTGHHPNLGQHPKAEHLRRVYAVLHSLWEECPRRTLPEAVDLIFDRLPVVELAAASTHGEQAVANLWKLRALSKELAKDPVLTWAGFVDLFQSRIVEVPEEAESSLAEESLEAIRVMSIHKAKGLEFPIVVLVGLHTGTVVQQEAITVLHDWSTGMVGIRLDDATSVQGVFIDGKLEGRLTAEQQRLLYVGMTRAKERLVLSGALTRRPASGNLLSLCREAIGEAVGHEGVNVLTIDEGRIGQTIFPMDEGKPYSRKRNHESHPAPAGLGDFVAHWQTRAQRFSHQFGTPIFVTPSSMGPEERWDKGGGPREKLRGKAACLGSIAHMVLQHWTFTDGTAYLPMLCEQAIATLPVEWRTESDFLAAELKDMLELFASSDAYQELRAARILGREVPFLMPFAAPSNSSVTCLMEGRIDLIYEHDSRLWVADFKTDRVSETDFMERTERYRQQARHYVGAVRSAFGRAPAGMKLIFVRMGKAVPVEIS
jgi:ATP-dependent helicase/nuclease subunit A